MTSTLESLCTLLTDGTHYTPPNIGEGLPFLTVADMQPAGLNFETCSRISHSEFAEADRQNSAPKRGDVLFSKDGTVGKVHVVNDEGSFAVLSSIAIIRPDPKKLNPNYLAHFLRSPGAISAAERSKTGSALRRIILKDIKRLALDPPPLPKQRRIAAILDQADALCRLRRQSLSRLSDLGQVIFLEMFGDPKVDRRRFARLSFEQSCSDKTAAYDKIKSGEYKSEGEIAIVDQGKSLIAGWVSGAKNPCRCETPVIVFGDHTRVVKLIDFPFVVGADGAKVLVPTGRFDAVFFSELLKLMPLPDLGYSRHMRELKRMTFICPPLEEQISFATRLSKVMRLQNEHSRHATNLDRLFASLQHRAFRGEL